MANIQIHTLNPAGSQLFADSESYLNDLSDAEMIIQGGMLPIRSSTFCETITNTFSTLCPI